MKQDLRDKYWVKDIFASANPFEIYLGVELLQTVLKTLIRSVDFRYFHLKPYCALGALKNISFKFTQNSII